MSQVDNRVGANPGGGDLPSGSLEAGEKDEESRVTEYYVLDDLAGDIIRVNKDMLRETKTKLNFQIFKYFNIF